MVPVSYNIRNLIVRWKTTLMTASGFTLVVAAMIVMLAFVNGLKAVCTTSGELENVIVLDDGASDEIYSRLDTRTVTVAESFEGVLRSSNRPLASRELFVPVIQPDASGGTRLLQARGVLAEAFSVHTQFKIVQGRRFEPSQSEVCIGHGVKRELGLALGDRLQLGRKEWTVVGVFESGGSSFEAEIWCDLNELAAHFRRQGAFTSVVLRTTSPQAARSLAQGLAQTRKLAVEAKVERAYYEQQAEQTNVILSGGLVIAAFMAIGAVFGVMNTMFAAIAHCTKDIAVMRMLGFTRLHIMTSFLLEALMISAVGGVLGCAVGYAANGLTRTTSIGNRSVEFAFQVDQPILLSAAAFALAMGLVGGILPALAAKRVRPLESLR
jgi:putative ABC transport system permease protein